LATLAVGLVAAGSLPGAAGAAPSATANANTDFGFSAEPTSATVAQPRPYFVYELIPGQTLLDQITVLNKTNEPETFIVYPEDATNIVGSGGFGFQDQDRMHNKLVGTWITMGHFSFTAAPQTAVVDTFQLTVPSNAPPGDDVGGIVVQESHPNQTQQSKFGVNEILRFAVRMYIHVVGSIQSGLTITDVSVGHTSPVIPYVTGSGTAFVHYTVVNSGNEILNPKSVTVSVTGRLGGTMATKTVTGQPLPAQMLPGGELSLIQPLTGIAPLEPLTAHVVVTAIDPTTNLPITVKRTALFWFIPWWFFLVLVLVVAGLIGLRKWLRRPPTAPAPPTGPPAGEPEEVPARA
jgi:hypothetical protein